MTIEADVQKALKAVQDSPPHPESPLPWHTNGKFLEDSAGEDVAGFGYLEDVAHAHACVAAVPLLAKELEAIRAKVPATYNGNLDAIFAHAAAYHGLGVTMHYAQKSEDADDIDYEEHLALLIKQRDDAEAEVVRLRGLQPARRPIPTTPIHVGPPMPTPPDDCASVVERELRAQLAAVRSAVEVLTLRSWPLMPADWVDVRQALGLEEGK